MAKALNYAKEYSDALAQAYPYALNFGALYNTGEDNRYRWVNAKTIEIPHVSTTGRVNASRDTIAVAQRNYDNSWETKTLANERKWSTLVHPRDIDETAGATSIKNITQAFNEFQKFPEMDAYLVSKLFADWSALKSHETGQQNKADETALTTENVLDVFDKLMLNMDNARVPANGRILYVTHEVKKLLENASGITRSIDVETSVGAINRAVGRLDQVTIVAVPHSLMKTAYNFTTGWEVGDSAKQINMFLVHPTAVITPVTYEYAQLDEPSAGSEGKYVYYEESHEDVFILNDRCDALQFNVTAGA